MKKNLVLLLAVIFFGSCAPKYTASFQNYDRTYVSQRQNSQVPNDNIIPDGITQTAAPISVITKDVAVASTANSPVVFKKEIKEDINSVNLKSISKAERKALVKQARNEIKTSIKEIKKEQVSKADGDPKKNGFAVAGFVTSLVGFVLFWPLCIVGIVLSALGLKSEKKGLAIAGLVIGIVGAAIVLIFGALFL